MKLPVFATQEEIPDGFGGLYEEKDGKWHPKDLSGGDGPSKESIEKLEITLEKERKDRKAAETQLKELGTKVAELETRAKAKEAGITDEKLTELREEIRADLEKEYEEFKTKAETLGQEVRGLKLDSQVKKLALEHGVRAERVDAWWRLFGDRFDLTDDGKPMVADKPGIEVTKLITGDLKKEMPDFYTGTQAAGGGAGGIQKNGQLVAGTGADDVIKNPGAALQAARAGGGE